MTEAPHIAGVELGGTKVIVLRGHARDIIERKTIPTTSSAETLGHVRAWLEEEQSRKPFAALGIASFGHLQPDKLAAQFGHMLPTPKPGWTGADILACIIHQEAGLGLAIVA